MKKITVDFPDELSYKGTTGQDLPPAWITVCHLLGSIRVSCNVPGLTSGFFYWTGLGESGDGHRIKELGEWQREQ